MTQRVAGGARCPRVGDLGHLGLRSWTRPSSCSPAAFRVATLKSIPDGRTLARGSQGRLQGGGQGLPCPQPGEVTQELDRGPTRSAGSGSLPLSFLLLLLLPPPAPPSGLPPSPSIPPFISMAIKGAVGRPPTMAPFSGDTGPPVELISPCPPRTKGRRGPSLRRAPADPGLFPGAPAAPGPAAGPLSRAPAHRRGRRADLPEDRGRAPSGVCAAIGGDLGGGRGPAL